MRERLGMHPEAAEALLSQASAGAARCEMLVAELQVSIEAARDPRAWLIGDDSEVMRPWSLPIAYVALAHLHSALTNATRLLDQVRAEQHDQRVVSSARDEPYALGLASRRAFHAYRRVLEGDPSLLPLLSPAQRSIIFAQLSRTQIEALARRAPEIIGGMDGAPAYARDAANRVQLGRLSELPGELSPERRMAVDSITQALADAGGPGLAPAQLYLLDLPADGSTRDMRVGIALGDLDSADNLAVVVPGMNSTASDSAPAMTRAAMNLQDAMVRYSGVPTQAVLAWIGYESPDLASVVSDGLAKEGAPVLAETLAGLNAVNPDARLTVLAHSYGTRVATYALQTTSGSPVIDGLFLFGSPGIAEGVVSTTQLQVAPGEVYATRAGADLVAPTGLVLSQPGGVHLAAGAAAGVLGLIGFAGAEFYLGEPGGVNRDPTTSVEGVRVLGSDGGAYGRPVGRHDMTTTESRSGYMDPGTDSLLDMALVALGRGSDAR